MPASPAAMRSWAPNGMRPWIRHENVSRMLAVLRGSRPNWFVMSLAMRPVVMIAIVLFAVHRLASDTRAAMLSSAPLLPWMRRVRPLTMKSRPPFVLISSNIPPASMVTMIRSPMPLIPLPIDSRKLVHPISPPQNPINAFTARPIVSTAVTSIPDIARAITSTYGMSFTHSIGPASGMTVTDEPRNT